jgi:pyridoxine kinase
MKVRKIEGYFSGVGDLFSALVCGHYHPGSVIGGPGSPRPPNTSTSTSPRPLFPGIPTPPGHVMMRYDYKAPPQTPISHATYMALLKTVHILRATQDYFVSTYSKLQDGGEVNMTDEEKDKLDPMRVVRRMRGRELRLVQCQDVLRRRVLGEFGMRAIGDDGMIYWNDFWDSPTEKVEQSQN